MNRIFISYRTSDAKKDAHRLAVDLERIFGDEQVFFDKHDLRGGAAWRESIGQALGERPVVLVVVTPDLVGAEHPEGGRRIEREDDPIRGELVAAQSHGALVMPLLTEGMTMPGRAVLPADLHFLAEAHALKLRTDDWAHDLDKLVVDLKRLGIQARTGQAVGKEAGTALGGIWMVFGAALLLWLIVAIGAHEETDPDTYTGAAVVMLFPLGMFIWCFRRLRAAQRAAQWGALGMAVLTGVMVLGYVQLAVEGTGHAVGSYRPPVTSITAPVV
jgi:hypothetical protein